MRGGRIAAALVVLLSGGAAGAQSITAGFPEFPVTLNIESSTHPAAAFIRRAVGEGLTRRTSRPPPAPAFELAVADGLQVDSSYRTWSFRISPGASFESGEAVTASDVISSLERCRARGELPELKSTLSRSERTAYDSEADWVDLVVEGAPEALREFPLRLAECPVFSQRAASLFGRDFGAGANLIASGAYRVAGFKGGKFVTLERISGRGERGGPAVLMVRSFRDSRHGLTALREGTLDLLFTQDIQVVENAKKDETLRVVQCSLYEVVHRSTLSVPCAGGVIPGQLRYAS